MRSGQTWLDPTQETVQAYLIGLCRELADLGFDEILLTHCAYPTQGRRTPSGTRRSGRRPWLPSAAASRGPGG